MTVETVQQHSGGSGGARVPTKYCGIESFRLCRSPPDHMRVEGHVEQVVTTVWPQFLTKLTWRQSCQARLSNK
jgi:hypothetical protein